MGMNILPALLALAFVSGPAAPLAQALPQAPSLAPAIEGRTLEGQPFRLAGLKGKVVLVMFWSTSCAVCRDKMPELRQNYEGWKGKAFEMVLVSTDRRLQDLQAYEQIISRTVPVQQRFVQLWAGEAGYRDTLSAGPQVPAAFLFDKGGRVVERWQGRMPAEAWDRIAELL